MRPVLHILLHFLVPVLCTYASPVKQKLKTSFILCSTMLVDLDHLLADPIYDPNRCSIGFHPLHSYYAILIYAACLVIPKLRLASIGLLIHMVLDYGDCCWMNSVE